MKVTINYFKQTGKWYTEEQANWEKDSNHYTGWQDFRDVLRLKDMIAVCHETPLGYPKMYVPPSIGGQLDYFIKKVTENAIEKGFTEATVGEDIALMHSELSEALEEYRNGKPLHQTYYEQTSVGDKPCGFASELADTVIRIFHFCGKHNIPLLQSIVEKMEYNKKRPKKHGGKII